MALYEIRARLAPMNLREVSRQSGVSYSAVRQLVKSGKNPSYKTVRKLTKWLESQGAECNKLESDE